MKIDEASPKIAVTMQTYRIVVPEELWDKALDLLNRAFVKGCGLVYYLIQKEFRFSYEKYDDAEP